MCDCDGNYRCEACDKKFFAIPGYFEAGNSKVMCSACEDDEVISNW